MNNEFSYEAPRTRKRLLTLLSEVGPGARILSGGTDLIVDMRAGLSKPAVVIDIKKVPGYGEISFSRKEGLLIGPAVTINQLMENASVRRNYPILVECGHHLASHQVRNRATVIGNICNASPCADMAPPLLCLGASVVVSSMSGERRIPIADFFAGVKRTSLETGEICERIIVPPGSVSAKGGYRKLKRIKGHDLSLVSVCVTRIRRKIRVAVGSAAPTPVFIGEFKASERPEAIVRAMKRKISPIDDVRASAEYRIFMAEVYLRRLLEEVR